MARKPTRRALLGAVAGGVPALAGCSSGQPELTPSATLRRRAGDTGDAFGWAVAVDGGRALAGAPRGGELDSGVAVLFERDSAGWERETTLTPPGDHSEAAFGRAVALAADRALVGAPRAEATTGGAVFVFERDQGWTHRVTLTPPEPTELNGFGWDLSLSGDLAVVGARGTDGPDGTDVGQAHVFRRHSGGWTHRATLRTDDARAYDYFGGALAVDGDRALVGSFLADTRGPDSGAADLFARDGGWHRVARLTPAEHAPGDYFGNAVALADGTAVVGAANDDAGRRRATDTLGGAGAANVFERTQEGWVRTTTLTAPDPTPGENFGVAVATTGDRVVVGAFGADDGTGEAHLFERADGGWPHRKTLSVPTATAGDAVGGAVALDGTRALVGATGDDTDGTDAGAAYVFEL